MAQASDYTGLITAQHAAKPKFTALVSAVAGCFADASNAYQQIVDAFDLDTAVGDQLDIIGQWVGLSRFISTPLAVYFSFDTAGLGFDQGSWKGPFDPDQGLTRVDDETYRTMLRVKIAANNWDGTLPTLQALLEQAFVGTGTLAFAIDGQDMTMGICFSGTNPSAVMSSLLTNGYLSLNPAGVKLNYTKTSISGTPIFGFDSQTNYIAGFDSGAWGIPL